jgi:hypothetical protein
MEVGLPRHFVFEKEVIGGVWIFVKKPETRDNGHPLLVRDFSVITNFPVTLPAPYPLCAFPQYRQFFRTQTPVTRLN